MDADYPVRLVAALHVEIVESALAQGDVVAHGAPFSVSVRWALPANHDTPRSGQFRVNVLIEAIGLGYEGPLGRSEPVPAAWVGDDRHVATIDVGAALLRPGVYKLVTMLAYDDPARGVAAVVGFHEGPYVEVRARRRARVTDSTRPGGIRLLASDP